MGWEIRGRWWNGDWSRRGRRDIRLSTDGRTWRVEARERTDRDWWHRDHPSERLARELIAAMLRRSGDRWTDLSEIATQGPVNRGR